MKTILYTCATVLAFQSLAEAATSSNQPCFSKIECRQRSFIDKQGHHQCATILDFYENKGQSTHHMFSYVVSPLMKTCPQNFDGLMAMVPHQAGPEPEVALAALKNLVRQYNAAHSSGFDVSNYALTCNPSGIPDMVYNQPASNCFPEAGIEFSGGSHLHHTHVIPDPVGVYNPENKKGDMPLVGGLPEHNEHVPAHNHTLHRGPVHYNIKPPADNTSMQLNKTRPENVRHDALWDI